MVRKLCLFVGLALCLIGCDTGEKGMGSAAVDSSDGNSLTQSSQPEIGRAYAPDGVEIHYQVSGQQRSPEDPTLVFIHGWSCNVNFWREQLDVFSSNHRVVALDLAGHGKSGIDRGDWRIVDFGDDVAAVATALKLDNVVLIGHSMGGSVALSAAQRMPGIAKAVIGVDTLHDADLRYDPQQMEPMIAPFQTDFSASMRRTFELLAGPTVPASLTEWMVSEALKANPEVATALLRDFARTNLPNLLREAGVPVRVINAAPTQMVSETRVAANRAYADYDAVIMGGVGHFLQLEQPIAFNQELARVIEGLEIPN